MTYFNIEVLDNNNHVLLSLWVFLLSNVHKTTGECLISLRELSSKWNCSPTTVMKWLRYLQDKKITVNTTRTLGTLVTIHNHSIYVLTSKVPRTPRGHRINKKRIPTEYTEEFLKVWNIYPNKNSKRYAFQCFYRLALKENEIVQLLNSISNYVKQCTKINRYFKNLSTFLNDDWREYIPNTQQQDDYISKLDRELCDA